MFYRVGPENTSFDGIYKNTCELLTKMILAWVPNPRVLLNAQLRVVLLSVVLPKIVAPMVSSLLYLYVLQIQAFSSISVLKFVLPS